MSITGCLPSDLEEGQTCATKEEADAYFKDISIMVSYLHNYVDYEVVKDNPVDRVLKVLQTDRIIPDLT